MGRTVAPDDHVSTPVPTLPAGAPTSLVEALKRNVQALPGTRAFVARAADGHTEAPTWSELDAFTDRLAHGLIRAGLAPGDRVALLMRNSAAAETLYTYYATHKAGGVVVPLNARFVGPEILTLLVQCDARLLVAEAELLEPMGDALRELQHNVTFVSVGSGSRDVQARPLETLVAGERPSADELPAISPGDYADWLFTSGTTGRPKCVMTTHAGCVATGMIMRSAFGLVRGDVLQTPFPFYTSSGCHSSALSALLAGATYVPDPEVDVVAILERIAREGTTVFGAVPAVLTFMLECEALVDTDLSKVRVLFSGGSAIPAPTVDRLLSAFAGAELTNVYGLTEGGNAGVALAGRYARLKAGSIGREPEPWTDYKIVDDAGAEVGPGGVGEILLRGPSIMDGYFEDPVATADALQGGWLHTGDLVRVDHDGFLFIHDRKKDMIIRGGFNISSLEVENVLIEHAAVLEVAVVAKPHARLGEDVCAFVVVDDPGVGQSELDQWCRARLADFKVPRSYVFLEALPKNPTGKILKKELRSRLAEAAANE